MFFFFFDPADAPVFGTGLQRFEAALNVLREADPKMTVSGAASLVHIARRLPALYGRSASLGQIADRMGMRYNSFMRTVDVLAEGGAKTRGLNLLESGSFPDDRRTRRVRLTPAGLRLLQTIDGIVEDGVDEKATKLT